MVGGMHFRWMGSIGIYFMVIDGEVQMLVHGPTYLTM